MTERFVGKSRKILNNTKLAAQMFKQMNAEFSIGAELVHLHIIEYKYFISKYN